MRVGKPFLMILWAALLMVIAPAPPANAQVTAPENVSVILILDNSGSMESNDPDGLRFTAARLFASLLDVGDSIGVLTFSTDSHWITEGLVAIENNRQKSDLVTGVHPAAPDGYTDVKTAFDEVAKLLRSSDIPAENLTVVLLTDGKPEIAQPYMAYEDETLGVIRNLGLPVLSIALTPGAKTPFLNRVAAETGGAVIPAKTASDLLDAYLEVFGRVKDRTVIGAGTISAPGQAVLNINPSLAPYLDQVSFIISKPSSVDDRLFGPGNRAITNDLSEVIFAVTEDARFAVVTLAQPAPGDWYFDLSGSGDAQVRAILHSRLRLAIDAPGGLHETGTSLPIVVRLVEEQRNGEIISILGEADFSALITRPDGAQESLDRFYDDGTHGDQQAGDGRYTRLYMNTDQPGTYAIALQGWKGVVPVSRNTYVEAVEFPEIILNAPLDSYYDIRDTDLLLQIHLEGGDPGILDAGGVIAWVTAPSGNTHEVPLSEAGGAYSGNFRPVEDGLYIVTFTPQNASYQGLPYTHTLETSFEVRIIPQITLMQSEFDFGAVEIGVSKAGLELQLPLRSSSPGDETISIRLEGLDQFKLSEEDMQQMIAPGENTLRISLLPSMTLTPGVFVGQVVFSAQEGVDLVAPAVDVHIEVFQPAVQVTPLEIDVQEAFSCRDWSGVISLDLISNNIQDESLILALDTEEFTLSQTTLSVPPGSSEVSLALTPGDRLIPGDYVATLGLSGRSGLHVEPASGVRIHFRVPPFWVRCRTSLTWGGIILAIVLMVSFASIRRLRAINSPPIVTGTLRYWHEGSPNFVTCIDLTALEREQITIGSDESCQVAVTDPAMGEQPAFLGAEDIDGQRQVLLQPAGGVRVKYRQIQVETPLQHGDTFSLGEHIFQYLSDEGE